MRLVPHRSVLVFGLVALAASACRSENTLIPPDADPTLSQPPDPENPVQLDRIVQQTEPKVDVLFVVDNSSSMGEEQDALQQNFPMFMDYFLGSGLDYHIAMVSTDVQLADHSGRLRVFNGYNYIDVDNPAPQQTFAGFTSTLGVLTGSQESGRAAAYAAVELRQNDPRNIGFIRPEAELHLIFVSDTFDNSSQPTRSEFLQWAAALKSRPGLVTMHAIVQLPGDNCPGWLRPGVDYIDYAMTTGGEVGSICVEDWEPVLDRLGLQVAGLKDEFFLSRIPVTDPELLLEVRAVVPPEDPDAEPITLAFEVCMPDTEDEACEVLYQPGRNSITFLDWTPPPLAEIEVEYFIAENFSADGDRVSEDL